MKRILCLLLCFLLLFCGCDGNTASQSVAQAESEASSQSSESSSSSAPSSQSSASSEESVSEESASEQEASSESSESSQSSEAPPASSESSASSQPEEPESSEAPEESGSSEVIGEPESESSESSQPVEEWPPASEEPESEAPGSLTEPEGGSEGGFSGSVGPSDFALGFLHVDENTVLQLVNEVRASLGLCLLQYDGSLHQAARIRSREMCLNDYFAHSRPDGRSWQTVLDIDVPIPYTRAGENLAAVKTDDINRKDVPPSEWVSLWTNSPSHYATMTDGRYTHAGVAICSMLDGSGVYHLYATMMFCAY